MLTQLSYDWKQVFGNGSRADAIVVGGDAKGENNKNQKNTPRLELISKFIDVLKLRTRIRPRLVSYKLGTQERRNQEFQSFPDFLSSVSAVGGTSVRRSFDR